MNEKKLAAYIDMHIKQIEDSMHVDTFAQAVAIVLAAEYGEHNYQLFIDTLTKKLNSYGN